MTRRWRRSPARWTTRRWAGPRTIDPSVRASRSRRRTFSSRHVRHWAWSATNSSSLLLDRQPSLALTGKALLTALTSPHPRTPRHSQPSRCPPWRCLPRRRASLVPPARAHSAGAETCGKCGSSWKANTPTTTGKTWRRPDRPRKCQRAPKAQIARIFNFRPVRTGTTERTRPGLRPRGVRRSSLTTTMTTTGGPFRSRPHSHGPLTEGPRTMAYSPRTTTPAFLR
mmetsp:Transcript_10384/g.32177  ORF Transcript_10384/g.32177 Transcript_10384/m.32177 type:complete len:226 (+) Transcript_10384:415-1092(+)